MAPKKSLLDQMRRNPRGDWDIKSVQTLCDQHGIELIAPKSGSHYKAKSPYLAEAQIIPANRPIKAPYIRYLVNMVDAHMIAAQMKGGA